MTQDEVSAALDEGRRDRRVGWWLDLVTDEFAYLQSEFGYVIDEVLLHFRGDMIRFSGSRYSVEVTYGDDDRFVGCTLVWPDGGQNGSSVAVPVWRLLQALQPSGDWQPPEVGPRLSHSTVREVTKRWARALQVEASPVLAGADLPPGLWTDRWVDG